MKKELKSYLNFSLLILKTYLLMIFTMFLIRGYFVFRNFSYIKESIPASIYIKGLGIGWIYDNAVISYVAVFFILSFLVYSLLFIFRLKKTAKTVLLLVTGGFLTLVYIIGVIDVQYFNEFGFHINSSIMDYSSNTTEIVGTFFTKAYHPFTNVSLIIIAILSNLFFINKFLDYYEKNKKTTIFVFINNVLFALVFLTLFVFGTRGGFKSATLNWGKAYFSKYDFANQMTLNGPFTFGKSYYYKAQKEKKGEIKKIYTLEQAGKMVSDIIVSDRDKKILGKNPLYREVTTGKKEIRPNVVLVLLESWSSYGIKSIGGKKELTPYFDKLASEGMLFNNFYAAGGRSNRGISSVSISYPSPLDESITKDVISSQEKFLSIGNILKKRDYNTHFLYGGDPHFDNMDGFLRMNGIDNIIGVDHFHKKDKTIKWGVPDDKLFDFGIEYMKKLKEPFFVNYFTLSNHPPYDSAPEFQIDGDKNDPMYEGDRAFKFSDYALGQFIEKVKKEKYANNTIFVFVADHGVLLKELRTNDPRFFHIPLLLWSPNKNLVNAKLIEKTGGQIDILPTLMGKLGGTYKSGAWGQDLDLENKENYAFVAYGNTYGLIYKDNFFYESSIEGEKLLNKDTFEPVVDENLKTKLKQILDSHIDLLYYQREQGIYGDK